MIGLDAGKKRVQPLPRARLEEAAEWWARILDEETSHGDISGWLDWLEAHPENRDAFERIQELALRLPATRKPRRRIAVRALAVAASAVFVIMGGLLWLKLSGTFSPHATLTLVTPIAAFEQAPLPDGSKVLLGGATSLEADYSAVSRNLKLKEGEAYFEVRPERGARPFIVNAGPVSIRALGTAFNVRKTRERVAVTVTEGRVQVAGSEVAAASVEVAAGEQALYDPTANRFRVTAVDARRSLSWRERRLEFVDEPLDSVIANVNRYSRTRIEARGIDLSAHSYTGTFYPDTIDDWLVAIGRAFPVKIEPQGDVIVIEPRE
jgi:transmembrane sensor